MGTENILRTKPLTVIDPNPRLGHPYEDIAEYLVKITKYPHNTPEKKAFIKKHITAGYERLSAKPINPNLLDAAMIIRCTWKMYSKISKKVENAFEEASILSKMMLEMGAKHGIIKKNQA